MYNPVTFEVIRHKLWAIGKVNIFDGHFKVCLPIATASFDLTNINPVGSLIVDAPKAILFHKGSQQINEMTIFLDLV